MKPNLKKIENIAKDVYRTLGSGFPEVVYDRAMQVGLRVAKLKYEGQKVIEVTYKDHYVGEGYSDLIVDFGKTGKILVELKAAQGSMGVPEETQLKNYMQRLRIRTGLLINFQQPGKNTEKTHLEIKEVTIR